MFQARGEKFAVGVRVHDDGDIDLYRDRGSCDCHYGGLYAKKLECMPLQINSPYDVERDVARWRLSINA